MLQGKNIAAFIDVDNAGLEFVHYENAVNQINEMGEVLYGKLYGVSDKKHKEIIAAAENCGYDTALTMRVKKRGQKVFDNRIAVDIVETVVSNNTIDAVAIVAAPADMVYLYRFLRRYGVKIIACDNVDEESAAFVDAVIDLGKVEELKLPSRKKAPIKAAAPVTETISDEQTEQQPDAEQETAAEQTADEQTEEDKTAALLKEIERLRENFNQNATETEESAAEEQAEQSAEETPAEQISAEETPDIVNEAQALLEQIERLKREEEKSAEQSEEQSEVFAEIPDESTAEDTNAEQALSEAETETEQNAAEAEEQTDASEEQADLQVSEEEQPAQTDEAPAEEKRMAYQPQSDSDLIRKIEEMRKNSQGTDDNELVEQIKQLLDSLE